MIKIQIAATLIIAMTLPGRGAERELDMIQQQDGVEVLENFSGPPDAQGVLGHYSLRLPAYTRGVYFQGGWWPSGGNRVYSRVIRPQANGTVDILEVHDEKIEGGLFAVFELSQGAYLAVLPLAGAQTYAWLDVTGGEIRKRENRQAPTGEYECRGGTLQLKFGHHGTAAVSGDLPICVWARGDSLYEAVSKVWEKAAEPTLAQGRFKLREDKAYPEIFRYLGWCSWDCIGTQCNEELMLKALKGLHASPVPIRWALMDDFHYDKKTLLNESERFPESYANLMKYRTPEKIRWIGIWYAMFGNFGGTQVNPAWDPVKEHYELVGKRMMPKVNLKSAKAYYRHMFREAKKHDFDLLKTDFQTFNIKFFRGKPQHNSPFDNPYAASVNAQRAFHEVVAKDFKALINCNWHNAAALFASFDSVVGRCSEDNKGGEQDAISHTFHAFAATPWLGQVAWGDHDMFHSGDKSPRAAKFNVIAKALSGSAIYLSEFAEHIQVEYVKGLCYGDGLLLRPLAPAAPLPEDLFHPMYDERIFAAIAPMANQCATIVAYDTQRRGPAAKQVLKRTLTVADYEEAGAMIQPYPGRWKAPAEGLLVYDWYNQSAKKLGEGYVVALKGFDYRVLQFSPIQHGWSVIGRSDKYLSAAAVTFLQAQPETLTIEMDRSGPLTLWSERGRPKAKGIAFKDCGNGLFRADIPQSANPVKLEIVR